MSSVFNVNGQQSFTSNVDVSGNIRFTSSANSIVYNTAPISIQSSITGTPIAVGFLAGTTSQSFGGVAIGSGAGTTSQGSNSISIGNTAGSSGQGSTAVAIGSLAGSNTQGSNSVAIGVSAAQSNQQINAVAIGNSAGNTSQGINSVAIGNSSGSTSQRSNCVAIGSSAGTTNQLEGSISIGYQAGQISQSGNSIAIGSTSGQSSQNIESVSIGYQAGQINQGARSIAIGTGSGNSNQGNYTIAIGYTAGQTSQAANTIVLNSSGVALNTTGTTSKSQTGTGGFFASQLRSSASLTPTNVMIYDPSNNEIIYSTAVGKTFVIQHPTNENKHLVHACLEGPEAGVYYRGEAEVTNGESVTVALPAYVSAFARDFTVQVSGIYDGKVKVYSATRVVDGQFQVYGENGAFTWLVHGLRGVVDVEPNKSDVQVNGSGPYLWLETA